MVDYDELYRLLGVDATVSWDTVRAAHRRLVRKWHPDRFGHSDQERRAAEERTKLINHAYQAISRFYNENGRLPVAPKPEVSPAPESPGKEEATSVPSSAPPLRPSAKPEVPPSRHSRHLGLSLLVGLTVGYAVWNHQAAERPESTSPLTLDHGAPAQQANPTRVEDNGSTSRRFGIGATLGDVYAIQGVPSRTDGDTWFYGDASIQFRNGRVVAWADPSQRTLKVAATAVSGPVAHFRHGSSKDEVRQIQGQPLHEYATVWDYGLTRVYFDRTGKVTGWDNHPLNPLNIDP
jgi:hypothetical protein